MENILGLSAIGLVLLGALSIVWSTIKTGISPMPSSLRARHAMLELVSENDRGPILELGSGWGQLAIDLALQNPQRQVIGYEASMIPYAFARCRQRLFGPANLQFKRQDFFETPLNDAGLLVCYLYPGAMIRLAETLKNTPGPELHLVSNTFRLPGFEAEETQTLTDLHRTHIYRFLVPAREN